MKRFLFLTFMMLCSIIASAQSLEFAVITGVNVNIRKAPSKSAQILMHTGDGVESVYCWASKAGGHRKVQYQPKGYIMQIVAKQTDWYKVRFYPGYGLTDFVTKSKIRYIEGWMSSMYLKSVKPIKLSWQNLNSVLDKYDKMVDDANLSQTVLVQDGFDGISWMLYGKIENDHLNIYGDADDLETIFEPEVQGAMIQKEENSSTLRYGKDVAIDDSFIDVTKCTPQLREQIFKSISNQPYSRRYYFNIGKGFAFDEDDGKRTFEIELK